MSIQQLEEKVRDLDSAQLAQFASWFDAYRSTLDPRENDEPELSGEQQLELEQRLDEFKDDLSNTLPWEGTAEAVLKELDAIRRSEIAHR